MDGVIQSASPERRRILLVGYRRDALDAAFDLDLEVSVVAERLPSRRRRERCAVTLRSDLETDTDWQRLARRLDPEGAADGVLALTEKAVEPAAHLRRALGLAGLEPENARACSDKLVMKRRVRAAGLACTDFVGDDEGPFTGAELAERLGLPLVLKARRGSGSRHVHILRRRRDLPPRLPEGWMAERLVRGVEMSVETLSAGGEVLFSNPTEYTEPSWVNLLPAALSPATARAVAELNGGALAALGLSRGISHLELFLTEAGPIFGEVAARPPGGHLMELLALAYGFDPWQAVLRLELGERPALPQAPLGYGAMRVLHPGAGTVRRAGGLAAARRRPGVASAQLRLRPGQRVEERAGLGQEVGHVAVLGHSREEALERLAAASAEIHIDLDPAEPTRRAGRSVAQEARKGSS